ncbi:MAG: chemotaxis protein [Sulfurimonas sp.]
MTQEELDALMSGDFDEDALTECEDEESCPRKDDLELPAGYSDKTSHHWPLPATEENKMVYQLDDVTKESEEKATEIFDIIEGVSDALVKNEKHVKSAISIVEGNIGIFSNLSQKFPDVATFGAQLEKNNQAKEDLQKVLEVFDDSSDAIMNVMDVMQYQDIHRQKIERVINVMRALSKYMNSLFEGRIEDEKRVASAQHIAGDTHSEVVSDDDIEALLAQFAKK